MKTAQKTFKIIEDTSQDRTSNKLKNLQIKIKIKD